MEPPVGVDPEGQVLADRDREVVLADDVGREEDSVDDPARQEQPDRRPAEPGGGKPGGVGPSTVPAAQNASSAIRTAFAISVKVRFLAGSAGNVEPSTTHRLAKSRLFPCAVVVSGAGSDDIGSVPE